ncbi:outer membrane protein assembly factor BamE [Falsirhodobacter halotolerans]|uniref:outer membrane protein assembly factor BamE n=1 Tax=Falsirhodobacter halotolerans TaxID=1146892 RepID=UPI001FD1546D|nr:outer membrane protein assembly factor BamE [Falsirhodobacter halotolerans]MCJ8139739.1 outer membrane protein assembly factor BamE [Falsirhodobacter halotolerans]
MMTRGAVLGLVLITLSACAPIFRNHGYVPMDQDLARVQIGASRDQVSELIGRPTTTTLLNDGEWYYVQSRFRTFGVFTREIRREVVAISFNGDRVANVERFGLEQGRVVPLSRRVTQNSVEGSSFLRQLFGSVGRIRADQVLDD